MQNEDSIVIIKGNAADLAAFGRIIVFLFQAFESLNPCLQMLDYSFPRNDACITYLDYPPARYPMLPFTCVDRRRQIDRVFTRACRMATIISYHTITFP